VPTTSRVPAAQDALLAALQAAITTAPVELGHPLDKLASTHVWLATSFDVPQEWDTTLTGAGTGSKAEDIPLPVVVRAAGSAYATARDVVFGLAAQIEDLLRADPHLGQPADVWMAEVTNIAHDAFASDEGWVALLQVTVTVHARLGE
jgi:hypothetical protein